MNGWTKYYIDKTIYMGSDKDISLGNASWRNSSFFGINKVSLEHNGYCLSIHGLGVYWQSDTYESSMYEPKPLMTKRRIEKLLTENDILAYETKIKNNEFRVEVSLETKYEKLAKLSSVDIGKWFILELDIINNFAKSYISDSKI